MAKSGKAAAGKAATEQDKGSAEAAPDGGEIAATIEIKKDAPVLVGEKPIAKLIVRPLTLAEFCKCLERAAQQASGPDQLRKWQNRENRKAQIKAYDAADKLVTLTDADILNMPRVYAGPIADAMSMTNNAPPKGEILSKGDAASTRVHYRFGTPIKTGTEGVTFEEVEFFAPTIGDIEDTQAEPNPLLRTLAFIRTCAAPVNSNMPRLPSWAVESVTLVDGVTIMEEIIPAFL